MCPICLASNTKIATPNGAGLSHNQFKDYNVGPNGVILNNGNGPMVNTQLGGIIVGNPNLKPEDAKTLTAGAVGSFQTERRLREVNS